MIRRMLVILLLIVAAPVIAAAQTDLPPARAIGEKVKLVSLFRPMDMHVKLLGHIQTQELLGAHVDWKKFDGKFWERGQSITNITQDLETEFANLRRDAGRLKSMRDEERAAFDDLLKTGAELLEISYRIQGLLRDGAAQEATVLYLEESRPRIENVNVTTYTVISGAEREAKMIALRAR